jgi:hypothetical protein
MLLPVIAQDPIGHPSRLVGALVVDDDEASGQLTVECFEAAKDSNLVADRILAVRVILSSLHPARLLVDGIQQRDGDGRAQLANDAAGLGDLQGDPEGQSHVSLAPPRFVQPGIRRGTTLIPRVDLVDVGFEVRPRRVVGLDDGGGFRDPSADTHRARISAARSIGRCGTGASEPVTACPRDPGSAGRPAASRRSGS